MSAIGSVFDKVGSGVHSAIAAASRRTGIDFNYLLGQAQIESSLNPTAKAATSSARGLYQFIDQSWLGVVKQHGAENGLGWAANSIGRNSAGKLCVTDPAAKNAIMALRDDPNVASLMAAEHASANKAAIEGQLGRPATGTDLYMCHFLGLAGASKFLSTMQDNPDRAGATLFPAAARANRNIFFAKDGSARSLSEIYDRFAQKLDKGVQLAGGKAASGNLAGQPARNGRSTSTLDQLMAANNADDRLQALLRPTPDSARLAYMMLARLGG